MPNSLTHTNENKLSDKTIISRIQQDLVRSAASWCKCYMFGCRPSSAVLLPSQMFPWISHTRRLRCNYLSVARWLQWKKQQHTEYKHVKNIKYLKELKNIKYQKWHISSIFFLKKNKNCTCNIPINCLSYRFNQVINLCSFCKMINDESFYCLYLKLYCIIWDVKKYLCPKNRYIFFAK